MDGPPAFFYDRGALPTPGVRPPAASLAGPEAPRRPSPPPSPSAYLLPRADEPCELPSPDVMIDLIKVSKVYPPMCRP